MSRQRDDFFIIDLILQEQNLYMTIGREPSNYKSIIIMETRLVKRLTS